MNSWWLLIIFPAGIAAAWFLMRRKPAEEFVAVQRKRGGSGPVKVTRNEPSKKEQHYYGASVQLGSNPCKAVKAIADKRFLSADAPHFPLPGCNRDECRCMMRPQDDRRAGYDRRGDSFSAYGNFELDQHSQKREGEKIDRRKPS
jgi:hypothetical protein